MDEEPDPVAEPVEHLLAGGGDHAPRNRIDVSRPPVPFSIVPYQTTHVTGGAVMGTDPSTSAVNRYLQSWDASNVFVYGACAFPQNAGYNPTNTVAALTYWSLNEMK